jgi:CubicO group peptidase (beta-lactamase class C family)
VGTLRLEASNVEALTEALARFTAQSETPGAALAWSRAGEPIQVLTVGNDFREPASPISARSGFRIASISKIFTGVLILSLVDQGIIQLDNSVVEFAPTWPELRDATPRQLLSHTSGLPAQGGDDGSETGPYRLDQQLLLEANRGRPFTSEETLQWVQGRPLLSEPGTEVHYSNTNFIVLAHIAEQVTGKAFTRLLERHVLAPLGLADTWNMADEPIAGSFVAGCYEQYGALHRIEGAHAVMWASHLGAAGALVSSAADLAQFGLRVLRDHEIIGEDLASEAFTIGPGGTGLGVLGVRRAPEGRNVFPIFDEIREGEIVGIGASGLLTGSGTKLVYLPAVDTVVVLLFNRSRPPGGDEFFRGLIEASLLVER